MIRAANVKFGGVKMLHIRVVNAQRSVKGVRLGRLGFLVALLSPLSVLKVGAGEGLVTPIVVRLLQQIQGGRYPHATADACQSGVWIPSFSVTGCSFVRIAVGMTKDAEPAARCRWPMGFTLYIHAHNLSNTWNIDRVKSNATGQCPNHISQCIRSL